MLLMRRGCLGRNRAVRRLILMPGRAREEEVSGGDGGGRWEGTYGEDANEG